MDRFAALQTFVGVYEAGSFSAAARRLHVGQPAVSKIITQLEKTIGVQLLLRSPRGLRPTEAGRHFYEHARRALQAADEAISEARSARNDVSGRLRISAATTFSRIRLIPYLKPFLDQNPELSLDLVLNDQHIDLMEEGIDVALRIGALAESSMTARRIASTRRLVLGTPAYFAEAGVPETPTDLLRHQVVVFENTALGHNWTFERGGASQTVKTSGRIRVSAAEGMRAAVLAHLGLAMGNAWMFESELRDGSVKAVLQDWTLPSVDLWAVYPAGHMASAKARAFVAFVENLLGSTATSPGQSG